MKKNNYFPNTLEESIINERVPKINYGEGNNFEFKDNAQSNISYSIF